MVVSKISDGVQKYILKQVSSKFLLLFLYTILFTHILSCILLVIEKSTIHEGVTTSANHKGGHLFYHYVNILYYLISTSTSVGYGDITINHKSDKLIIIRYLYQLLIMLFTVTSVGAFYTIINQITKSVDENVQKISTREVRLCNGRWTNWKTGWC